MSILPMINLKGGVAKTTNAVALAECLAARGWPHRSPPLKRPALVAGSHRLASVPAWTGHPGGRGAIRGSVLS
jgi:cellulose biosynthesis protein BcsQ